MAVTLCKRRLKSGNIQFYLSIYNDGKQSFETLFTAKPTELKEKKKIADSIRNAREIEVLASGTNYIPQHKKKLLLSDYFKNYQEKYDKKDIRMINGAISNFQKFQPLKDFYVSDLTQNHFHGFIDFLNNKCGYKGETAQSYWKRFKKVILQAHREGYIDNKVYIDVRYKKKGDYSDTRLTKQILTEAEIQQVTNVDCGNPEIKRAFLFACYTGLGLAECKVLKWCHITNNRLIIDREKNSAEINLALSKTALGLLGERQESENLIFDLTFNGKFISETSINRTLTNWVKRAGIEKRLSFYCGRHTFAVRLLTNGANLKTVSDALAHKSTANTVKYLNYVNSLKDEATANL